MWIKQLLIICFVGASIGLSAQGISFFEGSWKNAIKEAEKQGKLVFVDAYTTWCGPCKRMAKNEFTKSDVGAFFNENFISVKVDMEKQDGLLFGAKYPVSAYPTLFFLDGKGEVIKKLVGGKNGAQLIVAGKDVLGSFDFGGDFTKEYEAGDRSFEVVYNHIRAMHRSGKTALKVSNDYLLSDHGMNAEQKVDFLIEALEDSDSRVFQMFMEEKATIQKKLGPEKYQQKVYTACMKTVDKAIEFEYEALLEKAIDHYKQSSEKPYKVFESEQYLRYAKAIEDPLLFHKWSTKHWKFIEDLDAAKSWSKSVLKVFGKDKPLHELAVKKLKNYAKKKPDVQMMDLYQNHLREAESKEAAIKYLKKHVKNMEVERERQYIERVIKSLK